jgi:nodulation protein E
MVLGEGAGIIIVENIDAARARGAAPLAEFLGYGTSSDAGDMVRCSPAGAAAAMTFALADAQIEPKRVDHINAHGTGTVLNDSSETEAVRIAFGDSADRLSITSTKPIHGHALGATGALEFIAAVMSVRENYAPPTLNWLERDPKCDLDIVANHGRPTRIDIALSNSFAFGGINASLIVGKKT